MENFEYSIELSDRDWAEFLVAAAECGLAPAALAEEEPCPGDIEQGDGAAAGRPRGAAADASPRGEDDAAPVPGARGCEEGAASGGRAMEPTTAAAAEQPPGSPQGAARRRASGAAREEPATAAPGDPGGKGAAMEAVRPKTLVQARKSRRQRRAGDGEPTGSPALATAPPASPLARSSGKEKAATVEEAAKRTACGAAEAASAAPEPREAQDEAAERPGDSGGHHAVPAALPKAAPPADACRDEAGKLPDPRSGAAVSSDAAAGGRPANEGPASPLGAPEVTWPEMYDCLFCDSQGEEEVTESPAEEEEMPLERDMSLPELYEYFFNEPEGNRKKAKGKDRKQEKLSSSGWLQREDPRSAPVKESLVISIPEVYEHFFADGPGNGDGGRGLFLAAPASEVRRAVGALKSLLQRPMRLLSGQAAARRAPTGSGSGAKLPLVPLGRGCAGPGSPDTALALPGRPAAPLALTHKDMCLVFCAFASWAVKTSDLRAPDAWKTVFLASFGTLSAIRYFRRQLREGHPQT